MLPKTENCFFVQRKLNKVFDNVFNMFDLVLMFLSGNLENWWNPKTEAKYKEKAECMIEQYGNFTDPQVGIHLNGIITQGENIADNGGIKEAYKGYCKNQFLIKFIFQNF